MTFRIEIEPNGRLEAKDHEDTTTAEAIETVYREGPVVHIHMGSRAYARLTIGGGISDIYNDIVWMLKRLELGPCPFEVSFLCSCFTATWRIGEASGVLAIGTSWSAVVGRVDGIEVDERQFNDALPQFTVEKQSFVAEWHRLLRKLKHDLLSAGYGGWLENFQYLDRLDETHPSGPVCPPSA
jgi:hypothetical protein